jgi:hypothetical protein
MTYLPIAGSASTPVSVTANGGGGGFNGAALLFPAVGIPRTGVWIVIASFVVNAASHPAGNNWPYAYLLINGAGAITFGYFDLSSQLSVNSTYQFASLANFNAGDTTQLYLNVTPSTGSYASSTITAYFVPTPDHRQ